jgi:hypothetical protein
MKIIIIYLLLFILYIASGYAQTVLPITTTVYDFSKMKNGYYRIIGTDTTDFIKDTTFCIIPVKNISVLFPFNAPTDGTLNDGKPLTVGVKFRASQPGYILGIRYYRTKGNTGQHIGQLYSATGTLLWSAPFTELSTDGWQKVTFTTPIAINANTTYVAACYSPNGFYVSTLGGFNNAIINGPLTGLKNGTDGINGIYTYGSSPIFPTHGYQNSNYWIDIIYSTN